jgi:hypothetical protein
MTFYYISIVIFLYSDTVRERTNSDQIFILHFVLQLTSPFVALQQAQGVNFTHASLIKIILLYSMNISR